MNLLDSIVTQSAQITAIRRDIHAHPELAFNEQRTAELVARELGRAGLAKPDALARDIIAFEKGLAQASVPRASCSMGRICGMTCIAPSTLVCISVSKASRVGGWGAGARSTTPAT